MVKVSKMTFHSYLLTTPDGLYGPICTPGAGSFTDDLFVLTAILGLSDGIYERHEFAKRGRSFNEAFHDLDIPTTGVVRAKIQVNLKNWEATEVSLNGVDKCNFYWGKC
ncbi:hypothetical protein T01_10382 [Trichinella spiralis]|uniref:Uncharacterized protein n=1 Tax=Trichinella spiralis TaxID=6334 RepID=A0A0V1BIJ4_TRISP|nr:hypothetical protein T01_10382 [Trichinella spiralis]